MRDFELRSSEKRSFSRRSERSQSFSLKTGGSEEGLLVPVMVLFRDRVRPSGGVKREVNLEFIDG